MTPDHADDHQTPAPAPRSANTRRAHDADGSQFIIVTQSPAVDPELADTPQLAQSDESALEALIDAGYDLRNVPEAMRERVAKLAQVLGLLDLPISEYRSDDALVHVTLARVQQQRRFEQSEAISSEMLTADDADAVDQLVGAGMNPSAVHGGMKIRAERAHQIMSLLATAAPSAADRERLVSETLTKVQRSIDSQQSDMQIERRMPGVRFRMRDLVSVAALLLIGTAVIGPMVSGMRHFGQRVACQANLGSVASAFGLYAGDSRDSLPMASASIAGTPWWNVGKPHESNSANVYTLARTGYTKLVNLACPTNARAVQCTSKPGDMDWSCMDEVSFSFQNLFARERPTWTGGQARVVVLIDRSPVIPLAKQGFKIDPLSNSPNHRFQGQNALYNDGAAQWLRSPMLASGDNVWLPKVLEDLIAKYSHQDAQTDPLKGTESPATRDDSFVGP